MKYLNGLKKKYPELFLADSSIDPRNRTRTVPMEVMNLGFPRTGTMSLRTAFNILGLPCYHSVMFFCNIGDCAMWDAALDAKFFGKGRRFTKTDWDQLLGSYSAVSADPPAIAFAEDLIQVYPEAKVVLVEREIESWYESFVQGVIGLIWSVPMNWVADKDPHWVGRIRDTHMRWVTGWMGAHNKEEHMRAAKDRYREHYALVRRVTPEDQLLEYRLGDGWEPLCKFLGKPVPDVPFPRVNDQQELYQMCSIVFARGLWNFSKHYVVFALLFLLFVVVCIQHLYTFF